MLVPSLYMIVDDLFGWDRIAQGQKEGQKDDDAVIADNLPNDGRVLPPQGDPV